MEPTDPIPYRNADDDRSERRDKIGSFIAGFVCAILAVTIVGAMAIGAGIQRSQNLIGSVVVMSFFGIFYGINEILQRRPHRRITLTGFLIGAVLTALAEGICFIFIR